MSIMSNTENSLSIFSMLAEEEKHILTKEEELDLRLKRDLQAQLTNVSNIWASDSNPDRYNGVVLVQMLITHIMQNKPLLEILIKYFKMCRTMTLREFLDEDVRKEFLTHDIDDTLAGYIAKDILGLEDLDEKNREKAINEVHRVALICQLLPKVDLIPDQILETSLSDLDHDLVFDADIHALWTNLLELRENDDESSHKNHYKNHFQKIEDDGEIAFHKLVKSNSGLVRKYLHNCSYNGMSYRSMNTDDQEEAEGFGLEWLTRCVANVSYRRMLHSNAEHPLAAYASAYIKPKMTAFMRQTYYEQLDKSKSKQAVKNWIQNNDEFDESDIPNEVEEMLADHTATISISEDSIIGTAGDESTRAREKDNLDLMSTIPGISEVEILILKQTYLYEQNDSAIAKYLNKATNINWTAKKVQSLRRSAIYKTESNIRNDNKFVQSVLESEFGKGLHQIERTVLVDKVFHKKTFVKIAEEINERKEHSIKPRQVSQVFKKLEENLWHAYPELFVAITGRSTVYKTESNIRDDNKFVQYVLESEFGKGLQNIERTVLMDKIFHKKTFVKIAEEINEQEGRSINRRQVSEIFKVLEEKLRREYPDLFTAITRRPEKEAED